MDYEQSIDVVSSFLLNLYDNGLHALVTERTGDSSVRLLVENESLLLSALSCLKGYPGDNRLLAETLLRAVLAGLEPCMETLRDSLMCRSKKNNSRRDNFLHSFSYSSSEENKFMDEIKKSLLSLHHMYMLIRPHTHNWCVRLDVPSMTEFLPMNIRFKILQNNGECFAELEGSHRRTKNELFHFLRQHWRNLLNHVEKSSEDSFAILNDGITKCLHDLTLSSAREIQELLLEVLIHCMQDKLNDLDDDYSVRVLEPYLAWEERVIEPFLHACLPPPIPASSHFFGVSTLNAAQLQSEKQADFMMTPINQKFENPLGYDEMDSLLWEQGIHHKEQECKSIGRGSKDKEEEEDRFYGHYRMMVNDWSATLQHRLRLFFGRKRLATFWDVLVDFPDSIAALEDLRTCIQLNHDGTLRQELILTVRALLTQRLHRAGVRTEDIIEMVIKTVYALFIIFSYSEQSVVFSIIGDTLAHMGKRKDCAAAVVQSMQQLSELHQAKCAVLAGSASTSAPSSVHFPSSALGTTGGEAPDFFRVLSTVIPVSELVSGYRKTLSAQLLSKDLHDYDTSNEEEIIERLKCSLGERLLSDCIIMLRDISFSRRVSQRLVDLMTSRSCGAEEGKPPFPLPFGNHIFRFPPLTNVRALILSRVAWPDQLQRLRGAVSSGSGSGREEGGEAPFSFTSRPFSLSELPNRHSFSPKIHPSLESLMIRLSDAFHVAMPNRKLFWHHSLGRVKLHWMQRHREKKKMISVSFVVPLSSATILLYIHELSAISSQAAAKGSRLGRECVHSESTQSIAGSHADLESSESSGISVVKLAEVLQVNATSLEHYLQENLVPRMVALHYGWNPTNTQERGEAWVKIQTVHFSNNLFGSGSGGNVTVVDEGDVNIPSGVDDEEEKSGLSPQQILQLRKTVLALLRSARQKTLAEMTNSLKQFSPIPFSDSDLKSVLKTLEDEGLVTVVAGGGVYCFKR